MIIYSWGGDSGDGETVWVEECGWNIFTEEIFTDQKITKQGARSARDKKNMVIVSVNRLGRAVGFCVLSRAGPPGEQSSATVDDYSPCTQICSFFRGPLHSIVERIML